MNKNTKFAITIWIIVMIIPMLALTVMQPLPGTEQIKKETIDGTPRDVVHTVTIQEYISPYIIFIIATIFVYFFSSRVELNEKSKDRRNA